MQVPVPPAPMPTATWTPRLYSPYRFHPAGWWITAASKCETPAPLPTDGGRLRPTLNVMVQDLGILTKDEFLTLTRLQLKLLTGQPRPQRDELYAGLPGCGDPRMVRHGERPAPDHVPAPRRGGRKAYVLTGTVPTERLPQYRMAFHSVFASFTPPPVAPSASAMVPVKPPEAAFRDERIYYPLELRYNRERLDRRLGAAHRPGVRRLSAPTPM